MPCCACLRAAPQPLLAERRAPVDMNRMRIACPSCGAEYEVPDRLLAGAARSLRCSRCGADFALPEGAPAAAPPPSPAPEPPAERAPSPLPVAVPAP
ncbi:zinc-ribbon domain-containing protein, partial [Roseomonas rosulenta]|uniref:zinc-ribbon domain-containing protein n=1 Tax=Roseomonas rosulenta TaxID=2748667 RepID=UPI0034E1B72E